MTTSTYVLAGGGTGGHVMPGIAVWERLQQRDPGCRGVFIGSDRPLEKDLLVGIGLTHIPLQMPVLSRFWKTPWSAFPAGWQAVVQARSDLLELKPCVVIGLGGFASFPAAVAACWLGIPLILLEQNALPGRVTRWLARRAKVVCLTDAAAGERLSQRANVQVTGNPVRGVISALAAKSPLEKVAHETNLVLMVLGGSLGAPSLNRAVLTAVANLQTELQGWRVCHQTGAREVEEMSRAYAALGLKAEVAALWNDLPERLGTATIVISRGGATTLSELSCAGLATIVSPWASAADDHQTANARQYESAGACLVVRDNLDAGEQLTLALRRLLGDGSFRRELATRMRSLAQPAAADAVVDILFSYRRD